MDIDLLSKMVKELILDNDKVVLPGLGAFVAELVPSTFSDKGYTINPPYRKLYFRAKPDEGDALACLYAESNRVEKDVAVRIITDFVAELKSVLYSRKTVVFPGLGRLRATKENTAFFVADEDLDIYPEGFQLEPISLKTHVETEQQVKDVVGGLKAIVEEPLELDLPSLEEFSVEKPVESKTAIVEEVVEVMPVVEEKPVVLEKLVVEEKNVIEEAPEVKVVPEVEVVPEVKVAPEVKVVPEVKVAPEVKVVPEVKAVVAVEKLPAGKPERKGPSLQEIMEREAAARKKTQKVLLYGLLGLVVALFLLFIIIARVSPGTFDNLLYDKEELEIINRKL